MNDLVDNMFEAEKMDKRTKLKWVSLGLILGLSGALLYLKMTKFDEDFYQKEIAEIKMVSKKYIKNAVQKNDSLSYEFFTDFLRKEFVLAAIQEDSSRNYYQMWIPDYRLDSANILDISLSHRDSAKVFVLEFDVRNNDPDTMLVVYHFLKKSNKWRINGFEQLGRLVTREPIYLE